MLHNPKNRICPSLICMICVNMRRHPPGAMKGNRPSMTSTRAKAAQNVSLSTVCAGCGYFLAGVAGAMLLPRNALKNSDDGSTTMTSLFLLKLAL